MSREKGIEVVPALKATSLHHRSIHITLTSCIVSLEGVAQEESESDRYWL